MVSGLAKPYRSLVTENFMRRSHLLVRQGEIGAAVDTLMRLDQAKIFFDGAIAIAPLDESRNAILIEFSPSTVAAGVLDEYGKILLNDLHLRKGPILNKNQIHSLFKYLMHSGFCKFNSPRPKTHDHQTR